MRRAAIVCGLVGRRLQGKGNFVADRQIRK
jgi:hypothetical protein